MKISQKQANLLAKEVHRQLQLKKSGKISTELKNKLEAFVEKRKQLDKVINDARNDRDKHDTTIVNIVGRGTGVGGYEPLSSMVSKLEEKNIPKISEIEDEIILKAMFASEDDLQSFIEKVVKKYSTKLQSSKVVLN